MNPAKPSSDLPDRIEASVQSQLEHAGRELLRARSGSGERDHAVHQLRKVLQRLRAAFRLLRRADPKRFRRLERDVTALRHRFGALRDAAVRLQVARELASEADPGMAALLQPVSSRLLIDLDGLWQALPDDFWPGVQVALDAIGHEVSQVRWVTLRRNDLLAVLERQRRKARRAIKQALGLFARKLRHRMRCRIRRYAAMRELAAEWLGHADSTVGSLLDLGKRLGREGDLWLALDQVRRLDASPGVAEFQRVLRRQRRALVRQHDGELAGWLRRVLARKERRRGKARGSLG